MYSGRYTVILWGKHGQFKPLQHTTGRCGLYTGSIMPTKTQIKKLFLFSITRIGYDRLVTSPFRRLPLAETSWVGLDPGKHWSGCFLPSHAAVLTGGLWQLMLVVSLAGFRRHSDAQH